MKTILLMIAGGLFSGGLTLSGMTHPKKVMGFLDFFGNWDPSLLFVLGGAVFTYSFIFHTLVRKGKPIFAPEFELPQNRKITLSLVLGAALFGVGWGLSGLCPGPAFTSLFSSPKLLWFVGAMVVGIWISGLSKFLPKKNQV